MTSVRTGAPELRKVYGTYPTGVAVLAAMVEGRPVGLAASSFVPVSLEPPLVSVCVAHTSTTWPALKTAARIGISVLAADQETVGRQVGSRVDDRFAGLDFWPSESGAVVLGGAAAWFECSHFRTFEAGDHDIIVLEIHDHDLVDDAGALVFHGSRFRSLR